MEATRRFCRCCGQPILPPADDDDRPVPAWVAFRSNTILVLSPGRWAWANDWRVMPAGVEIAVEVRDGYNPDVADLYFPDGSVAGGIPREQFITRPRGPR